MIKSLTKNAQKVVEELSLNIKSGKDVKNYGLDSDTDKTYYVYCSWGSGSNGSFEDKEGLEAIIIDAMNRNSDEAYDIEAYKVPSMEEVSWKVEIKVVIEKS